MARHRAGAPMRLPYTILNRLHRWRRRATPTRTGNWRFPVVSVNARKSSTKYERNQCSQPVLQALRPATSPPGLPRLRTLLLRRQTRHASHRREHHHM
ncbi:hypothetical protein MTO96_050347 [Rhipicephalus appendiculatus]